MAGLRVLQGVAAFAHFSQFLASLLLVIQDKGITWPLISRKFENDSTEFEYYLSFFVPVFPLLSSINHLVAFSNTSWYNNVLQKKVNPLRWAEYSFSAGVMLWIIGTLSGILEIRTLVSIALMNAALQYVGYLIEKAKAENNTKSNIDSLITLGFAIHTAIWVQIFISFFTVISDDENSAPPGVYSVIVIMFVLFSSFGVWSTLWAKNKISSFELVEKGYIFLSLGAKSFLTWMVYFGVLKSGDRFEKSPKTKKRFYSKI